MKSAEQSTRDQQEALIRKASVGDLEAFNQLVLLYQNVAYHTAYSLLGDPAWAEDITQESFIKAFQEIHNFRGGSFRAWLLKIVTNSAYDLLRWLKRRPVQPLIPEDEHGEEIESPAWLVDPSTAVELALEQDEENRRLYQLLEELPAIHRNVLTLIDLFEMDYREVAQVLDVPLGTVKSRLARARLLMKKKIESEPHFFWQYAQPVPYASG